VEKGVVLDEMELSKATNQIKAYADFLVRVIEEYMNIVANIPEEKAISDILIRGELIRLIAQVAPLREEIDDTCEMMSQTLKGLVAYVEAADNFKYPGEFAASVSALLASFL